MHLSFLLGDLAYLSKQTRKIFRSVSKKLGIDYFAGFSITASNDINEDTLVSLNQQVCVRSTKPLLQFHRVSTLSLNRCANLQGHEIDVFGIGTNLVTCQAQPALGCVYKLVEIHGTPRIKLSQEVSKVPKMSPTNALSMLTPSPRAPGNSSW